MKKIKIYKVQGFYRINIPKVIADILKLDKEEYLEIEYNQDNTLTLKKIQKKYKKVFTLCKIYLIFFM